MRKALIVALVALISVILLYLPRFWFLSLWPRSGLFAIEAPRPRGGLLGRWRRGTDAPPFELLIWAVGYFLILTLAQKTYDYLTPIPDTGDDHDDQRTGLDQCRPCGRPA